MQIGEYLKWILLQLWVGFAVQRKDQFFRNMIWYSVIEHVGHMGMPVSMLVEPDGPISELVVC